MQSQKKQRQQPHSEALARQMEQQAQETKELCKRVDALETKLQRQHVLGIVGSLLRWIPMLDQWLF